MPKRAKSADEVRIEARIRQRLANEFAAADRGAQSDLATKLGFSTAHVSNVLQGDRGFGLRLRRALASHWGLSLDDLEAWALGKVRPFSGAHDPPIGTLLRKIRDLDGLAKEIDAHPEWLTSTIARAVSTQYDSPDGVPRGGWHKALTAIESGEGDRPVGGADEAAALGIKRAGKRRPLPGPTP